MKLIEITDVEMRRIHGLNAAKARPRKSLLEVAAPYKKNIKAALDNKLHFFRGADSHRPITDSEFELNWHEQPARTDKRNSVFGNGNWLMSWVEATWDGYPKRSMSYFTTQAQSSAENFARHDQVLMIIPRDDVKSFATVETDFNEASTEAQTLMAAIQQLLAVCRHTVGEESTPLMYKLNQEVFKHRGIKLHDPFVPTAETIKHYIGALDELLDNLFQIQQRVGEAVIARASTHKNPGKKLVDTMKEFRGELKEMGFASLEEYAKSITPKSMGAKLYTDFGQIKSSPSSDDELWFEGSYLGFYGYDDTLENLKKLYDRL